MKPAMLLLLLACGAAQALDLGARLDDLRQSQDVAGIAAIVVSRQHTLYAGASGVADLESGQKLTPESVFYAGSLSKVLTAVLVLHLVERDRLALDDRVDGINGHPITVRQLLTHASGLPREGEFGYWFSAAFPDKGELAEYLSTVQLRGRPGTSLHYSNVGYAALGPVIRRSARQGFVEAMHRRVLAPLQMTSSGARGPATDIVNGYAPPGRLMPNDERPFAGVGKKVGDRHVRMYHDAGAMSPAFGAYTSAADLGRLARFLLGRGGDEVLSSAMRRRMLEPQPSGWGLGLRLQQEDGRRTARHGGWFAAHRSYLLLDLDRGIGVAVLTNGDNANPEQIADVLLEATLSALSE